MAKFFHHQYGMTLIVSLVMLLILTILSTSLTSLVLMDEKAARNELDQQIAMQAAESALADAEQDIENSTAPNSRSAIFSANSHEGFSSNCSIGDENRYQGLCIRAGADELPVWINTDITNTSNRSPSVRFGRFTDQTMPHGAGPFSNELPRYIIELLPDHETQQSTNAEYVYRITAVGFGVDRSTQVVLQSVYRKANADSSTLKTGRLSWREISNWQDIKGNP